MHSNKRLHVEIKLNSLAEIRRYLFNFGTGVPKIRGAEILEEIQYVTFIWTRPLMVSRMVQPLFMSRRGMTW